MDEIKLERSNIKNLMDVFQTIPEEYRICYYNEPMQPIEFWSHYRTIKINHNQKTVFVS